jgi:hypothetical protein
LDYLIGIWLILSDITNIINEKAGVALFILKEATSTGAVKDKRKDYSMGIGTRLVPTSCTSLASLASLSSLACFNNWSLSSNFASSSGSNSLSEERGELSKRREGRRGGRDESNSLSPQLRMAMGQPSVWGTGERGFSLSAVQALQLAPMAVLRSEEVL